MAGISGIGWAPGRIIISMMIGTLCITRAVVARRKAMCGRQESPA
jgi:hypothetical protein